MLVVQNQPQMMELMAALVLYGGSARLEGVNTSHAAPLRRAGGKFLVRVVQCTLNAFPARSRLCDTHLGSTCELEETCRDPLSPNCSWYKMLLDSRSPSPVLYHRMNTAPNTQRPRVLSRAPHVAVSLPGWVSRIDHLISTGLSSLNLESFLLFSFVSPCVNRWHECSHFTVPRPLPFPRWMELATLRKEVSSRISESLILHSLRVLGMGKRERNHSMSSSPRLR